jgi:hypothetical protein
MRFYDGSEEAVDWTTARRRLLLCFAPVAFDGSEEACRCCRRLSLCERLSVLLLLWNDG